MHVRIMVTGSRHWGHLPAHHAVIRRALSAAIGHLAATGAWAPGGTITLVHGACTGTDTTAADIATQLGWLTDPHPVDWDHERATRPTTWKQAGPERNTAMCAKGAHLLLAFPGGDGTANCVTAAHQHAIPVFHIPAHSTTPALQPHSIKITCDPFTTALAFYTQQLGLPLATGPRTTPDGRAVAFVALGALQLELISGTTAPAPQAPVRQLNLTCDDPDTLYLALARRGLTPAKGPWRPDTGDPHQPVLVRYAAPGGFDIIIRGPKEHQWN